MDRRILRTSSCNGGGKNPLPSSPAAVSRSASSGGIVFKNEDAAGERKALLPKPKQPGGLAQKGRKRPNRRVHWKDRHGSKLTDVKEFQPSDSSDSDDEYLDTCICSIM